MPVTASCNTHWLSTPCYVGDISVKRLDMRRACHSFVLLCLLSITVLFSPVGAQSAKPTASSGSFEKMSALRRLHGNMIPVNTDAFKKYVKSPHTGYSVVAMFTALKREFQCEVCPDAKREFSILASSYAMTESVAAIDPVFFVIVDYNDAAEAFKMMKLQHVPGFYFFPGSRKRTKSDTYSARRSGYSAVSLARWLAEIDGITIKISIPFDYSKLTVPFLILFTVTVIGCLKPGVIVRVLGNRVLWGVTVMSIVLLMTSGQMWNHIRKPAKAGRHGNDVQYIMGSRGGQYIFESYIVMGINFAVATGFILLNEAPDVKHRVFKKALGFLGVGLVVVCFGFLISIFRKKSRGYPYSFLFE